MAFPLQNQRHFPRCTEVLIHAFIYWPYPIEQASVFYFLERQEIKLTVWYGRDYMVCGNLLLCEKNLRAVTASKWQGIKAKSTPNLNPLGSKQQKLFSP